MKLGEKLTLDGVMYVGAPEDLEPIARARVARFTRDWSRFVDGFTRALAPMLPVFEQIAETVGKFRLLVWEDE